MAKIIPVEDFRGHPARMKVTHTVGNIHSVRFQVKRTYLKVIHVWETLDERFITPSDLTRYGIDMAEYLEVLESHFRKTLTVEANENEKFAAGMEAF